MVHRGEAVDKLARISGDEAVILSSAVHHGKWLPGARQFADLNSSR